MVKYYESPGVTCGFLPLLLSGKAKAFGHLCPDPSSDKAEDLGAYQRFHSKESQKKWGDTGQKDRVAHMLLIGDDYYFEKPRRKVERLGYLPDNIIRTYSKPNKLF